MVEETGTLESDMRSCWGIGKGGDNGYKNFDVLARKIAASSATVPGNKDWETYEMGFLLQYKPADVDDLKALK